jgi:hypothetical protein
LTEAIEQRYARVANGLAAMIFFAPEATESYEALGLNWYEAYFCSRSAAFGRSSPEIVISTFYNFFPGAVQRAVEGGWSKTTPDVLAEARFKASGEAMRRLLAEDDGSLPDIDRVLELQWRLVDNAPPQGRPLYAAHLGESRRTDPFAGLWQTANLMREFRGDGHIAVLVAHGIGPVEALILHAPMLGIAREDLMRGPREWPDEDLAAGLKRLAERGLVEGEALSAAGIELRKAIEDQTNVVSGAPFRALGADAEELIELLGPLSQRAASRQSR